MHAGAVLDSAVVTNIKCDLAFPLIYASATVSAELKCQYSRP